MIRDFGYWALTQLRYQSFDNRLEDVPRVRTPIRQSLLQSTCTIEINFVHLKSRFSSYLSGSDNWIWALILLLLSFFFFTRDSNPRWTLKKIWGKFWIMLKTVKWCVHLVFHYWLLYSGLGKPFYREIIGSKSGSLFTIKVEIWIPEVVWLCFFIT